MNTRKLTLLFTIIGISLFIASLTQKSYCAGYYECQDSIDVFTSGWLGLLVELIDFALFIILKILGHDVNFNYQIGATSCWLANPLIIISFVTLSSNPKSTIVLSLLSTLLILSFLLYDSVILHFSNFAGFYLQISSYKAGYYLWLASSLTMLAGSIYLTIKPTDNKDKNAL